MTGNRYTIESFSTQNEGTARGQSVKNMHEKTTEFQSICEYAGIDFVPDDEDENDGYFHIF